MSTMAHEDPYAIVSKATDEDDFLKVWMEEGDESFMELPKEEDGTVMITTLQGQFPNAVGLRYRSSSGGWRGVRISDGVLNPPQGGWAETKYVVTPDSNKCKSAETDVKTAEEKEEGELLQDLFVLHLPRDITDDELKNYFTKSCGEMLLHEVKFDRETGRSRGFGFIRFKTVDAAKEALNGEHIISGQRLEVRLSRRKESPCQLFIGRLPEGVTQEDLNEYFSKYGEVTDAYITNPFRGFGFITYASTDIARSILRLTHEIKGTLLNVAVAEPKEEKMNRRRRQDDWRDRSRTDRRYDPRSSRRDSPPRSHNMMSEFKNMLFEVMDQRR